MVFYRESHCLYTRRLNIARIVYPTLYVATYDLKKYLQIAYRCQQVDSKIHTRSQSIQNIQHNVEKKDKVRTLTFYTSVFTLKTGDVGEKRATPLEQKVW